MKTNKIPASVLKELFVVVLRKEPYFSCSVDVMPFSMSLGGRKFYIYIKTITSAYFSYSDDITRVQLPKRAEFLEINKSNTPFIMLGYDKQNDVFVCWNPVTIKERLNAISNVSLYSRQSFQNEVAVGEFKKAYLSNNDKLILFKRQDLLEFFNEIDILFPELETAEHEITKEPTSPVDSNKNKLESITDSALLEKIKPILKNNRLLEAISITMDYYHGQYPDMSLRDWARLVRSIHSEVL